MQGRASIRGLDALGTKQQHDPSPDDSSRDGRAVNSRRCELPHQPSPELVVKSMSQGRVRGRTCGWI